MTDDDIARAYAPLIFFHRHEQHFPVDPDDGHEIADVGAGLTLASAQP